MVEDLNGILCLLEDRHCGLLLHLSTMASNQRTKASQFKLLKVKQVSGVNLKYVLGGKIVTISSQLSLLLLFPIFCFLPFLRRVLLVVLLSLFFHPSLKKLECGWWATFVMKTQKHGQSSLSDFGLYFLSFIFFFIFFSSIQIVVVVEKRFEIGWYLFSSRPFLLGLKLVDGDQSS